MHGRVCLTICIPVADVCRTARYIHMEEMCRETAKARAIFDRWMAFEPDHAAWMAYIKVRWRA